MTPSLWILLALIALFTLGGKKIWTRLSCFLDERAFKIKQDIEDALSLRDQSLIDLQKAQDLRKNAEKQAKKIEDSVHQDIIDLKKLIQKDLQNFLHHEHLQFLSHQKIIENQILYQMEQILIDQSLKIALQFISTYPQPEMDNFLMTKALEKIDSYSFKINSFRTM